MRPATLPTLAFALALLVPGMGQAQEMPPEQPGAVDDNNLVNVLQEAGEYQTLLTALEATGLTQPLAVDGPFTLFAPTDAAFDALPEGQLDQLMQDPESLQALLAYHIVPGEVTSAELSGMESAETAFGLPLQVQSEGGGIQVEGANVVTADMDAANGVIHSLDQVMSPPTN
jgi:uncharacterized surface protein with fasciclin (FAS1) repeats